MFGLGFSERRVWLKTTVPIEDILGVNFYIWGILFSRDKLVWEKSIKSIFKGQILVAIFS